MEIFIQMAMCAGVLLSMMMYVIPIYCVIFLKEKTYATKDYSLKMKVAVLLPCFNEGEHAYKTIKSICDSNYPAHLLEVIAVDDHSTDDSWSWITKAQKDFSSKIQITTHRQAENAGKYEALSKGASLSRDAEIFICIDSDCSFHPEAVTELVASFTSDKIAAVGGHVKVSNVNENMLTKAQSLVYFYAYHVMKMYQNYLKNIVCISGCLMAIRKSAFYEIEQDVRHCNFLGAKFSAGEDRYMTHLLLLRGHQTIVNLDAVCWTEVPSAFRKFFLQQWRWRRSGIQDYLLTVRTLARHSQTVSPSTALNLLLPESINYILLITFVWAICGQKVLEWFLVHQMYTYCVMGPFLLYVGKLIKTRAPDQQIEGGLLQLLPFLAAWVLTGTVVCSMLALFTMDSSSWGTRVSAPKPEPDIEPQPEPQLPN